MSESTILPRAFYARPAVEVARDCLGKILVHGKSAGRIVEVEAYLGVDDRAAHAWRGLTDRTRVIFGQPGHAYVYFIYGMYYCVNVTCEPEGMAGCILIRALEPVLGQQTMTANRKLKPNTPAAKLTGGPGRLCQALAITRPAHNGLDLLDPESPLQLRQDDWQPGPIQITPRIGIRHAADLPLRFAVTGHSCVSPLRPAKAAV